MSSLIERIVRVRVEEPERIRTCLAQRRRRQRPLVAAGTLLLIAADHPGRGSLGVGPDAAAMADREDLLRRLLVALQRPGVDGLMATADIVEDLCLLGALDDKVVLGSMNRGGLVGSNFELDDGFTGYTAAAIARDRLDGGKMMVRIDDRDAGTLRTLEGCARAVDELAARGLPAMIEVFAVRREGGGDGRLRVSTDPRELARAMAVASALGGTSAYTWLKIPATERMDLTLASTSLPVFLLGGDPGPDINAVFKRWSRAMAWPQVRGLVAGRALLYPGDGDVAAAVDRAAAIVGGANTPQREREGV